MPAPPSGRSASRLARETDERRHRRRLETVPRRYTVRADVTVAGQRVSAERWGHRDLPGYGRLVVPLAEVEIVLLGWTWPKTNAWPTCRE
jgi:hypothetical protein